MAKLQAKPLASSPLVAIAERASEAGGKHGAFVVLDGSGNVCLYPTDETPPVLLAGMLTFALSLLTDGAAADDDDEDPDA
jgi:hypothetical protein